MLTHPKPEEYVKVAPAPTDATKAELAATEATEATEATAPTEAPEEPSSESPSPEQAWQLSGWWFNQPRHDWEW